MPVGIQKKHGTRLSEAKKLPDILCLTVAVHAHNSRTKQTELRAFTQKYYLLPMLKN